MEHYTLVIRSSKRSYGATNDFHIDCGQFFQNFNGRTLNGKLVSWVFPNDTGDDSNTTDKSLQIKVDLHLPHQTDTDNEGMQTIAVLSNNDKSIRSIQQGHDFTCVVPNGNVLHFRIENASSEALAEDVEENILVLQFTPM